MSILSQVLNGAKIANIAKRENKSTGTIYNKLYDEVLTLNRKHGTNLSTHITQIKRNPDAYKNLIKNEQPKDGITLPKSNDPKRIYNLLRFTSPLEAINNLTGDMRIGAVIMYNTLKND